MVVASAGIDSWIDPDVEVGEPVAELLQHAALIVQAPYGVQVCNIEGGKRMQA